MVSDTAYGTEQRGSRLRLAAWGGAALLLLAPLVAMNFTAEVQWTLFDFVFAGALLGGVGLALELTVRKTRNAAYRAGVAILLAAVFLTIFVNGAVGMIGSEENRFNLLFLGVILLAVAGAVAARFRASGMSRAMVVAAVAQIAVSLAGLSADLRGGLFSAAFAGLWLAAALLFGKAAREQASAGERPNG